MHNLSSAAVVIGALRVILITGLQSGPSYSLCVSDQSRTWEQGKTMVFDDSFLHSVSHSGDETDDFRAVLIVDIWHPDLTRGEREILDIILAPV